MKTTRTGNFPIGFRLPGSPWAKDMPATAAWAAANGFGVIDLRNDAPTTAPMATAAGVNIGTADLIDFRALIHADGDTRRANVTKVADHIAACAAVGTRMMFCVMLPADPALKRRDNFSYMMDSLSELAPTLDRLNVKLAIEGWPGPGALCCTPETVRACFQAAPTKNIGYNYDPSHLIRMGIDPIRFLEEFAERVYHVHGKDTELLPENVYEFGTEQPPTFGKPRGWGSITWRYTIPGHGVFRWTRAFEILQSRGYSGAVCIELEDENFNGTEAGEKNGLLIAANFLAGC